MANHPQRRTRGAERQKKEGSVALKEMLQFGAESLPGVGEVLSAKRTGDAIQEKDYIGAAVEAAAGVLGIVPIVGDAAGRALRSATRSLRKDAKLTVDNPGYNEIYGETYAETKQRSSDEIKKRAVDRGEVDTYQVNLGSSEGVTGYANKVKFKPEELKDLPGAMGEEKFRSTGETIIDGEVAYNKLKGLKESIAKEGYNPKGSIMIHVREDGQPFIVEGNHRLAEALESGRETIDADIRYLRGAEEKAGPLDPRFIFPDKRAPLPKYNLKNPDSRVFHLTSRDYDAADVVGKGTDDMGFHVGTAKQASGRGTKATGERILPMVLKAKLKPARIPDLGSFKEPKNWLANLAVDKNDRQIMKFLKGDPEDAELLKKAPTVKTGGTTYIMSPDVIKAGVDPDLWKDLILEASRASRVRPNPYQIGLDTVNNRQDRLEWFSTIKGVANKHGYDSYIYKNDYEGKVGDGPQDSYMLLEADQAKGIFGGLTEGEPEFMKNRGGVISMKKGGIAEQMEMFEPVKRGFDRGGMGLRKVETGEVFDFNAIANDYNQSIGKDIMTGQEMAALFDAFIDMKTAAKTSGMNEGGLAEEGGSVDPVSGNSVPPGSTKEEVRDDIPAQLSEGEFVFPADVVRYIGLEKLMRLRQEAKMGLAAMEAMGQMGNSEEATMPDDLPFDMYDLDIEDDNEYNMAQGGVVKMQQGGTNYTPPTIGGFVPPPPVTTGFSGPQPVQPFQSGQTQFQVAGAAEGAVTPKTAVDPVVPTFSDFIGQNIPGVDFTMVTFYDENGQAKVLKKFPDGSFEDPANPGTKVTPADMGLTEEMKTAPTTTQQQVETARVVDDRGNDKDEPGPSSTDVTGIGYNNSKLTTSLRDVVKEFGAGFGTLKDAFNNQMYERAQKVLGLKEDISAKANAITSASLGGVFDNFRGVTVTADPRTGANVRAYADRRSLDSLSTVEQNRLAKIARATVTTMRGYFTDDEGDAIGQNKAEENLSNALASDFGLTSGEIEAIATAGGNFNRNQKLARHLAGLIAKDETRKDAEDRFSKAKEKVDTGRRTEDLEAAIQDTGGDGGGITSQKSAEDFGKADVATGADGGGRSEDADAMDSGYGAGLDDGPGA